MRVLICGGRNYNNKDKVFEVLDNLRKSTKEEIFIIHGGAKGADSLGGEWARTRNISVRVFKADWNKYGRAAGIIRNEGMLKEGKPDLVVAFPGGKGTAHMIMIAEEAGVEVKEIFDEGR